MINRKSINENEPSQETFGELCFEDQLYNALHGVDDISHLAKVAVTMVMHDYYNPQEKIVTEQMEKSEYGIGRDRIIHIVTQCLATAPDTANAALSRWVFELIAEMRNRVDGAIQEKR